MESFSRFFHRSLPAAAALSQLAVAASALAPGEASALPLFSRQTGQSCATCHAGERYAAALPSGGRFNSFADADGVRGMIPFSRTLRSGAALRGDANDGEGRGLAPPDPLFGIVPAAPYGQRYTGTSFDPPVAPRISTDAAPDGPAVGLGLAAEWKGLVYAEFGAYRSARNAGGLSPFARPGIAAPDSRPARGLNPYWRLALNYEWGAHGATIGLHGLSGRLDVDPADARSPSIRSQEFGIDGQYRYASQPYGISARVSFSREKQRYDDPVWNIETPAYGGALANAANTVDLLKVNATYTYESKYGASLSYVSATGTQGAFLHGADPLIAPFNNASGTRVWVPEVFLTPAQYLRIGLQYYKYTRFAGGVAAFDGSPAGGARDNDLIFIYLWSAY